jgi:hypothetical protein
MRLVIRDQRSRSRTLLYPWVRIASRVAVTLIVLGKQFCPPAASLASPDGGTVRRIPRRGTI